jgi:hypothetical protein
MRDQNDVPEVLQSMVVPVIMNELRGFHVV